MSSTLNKCHFDHRSRWFDLVREKRIQPSDQWRWLLNTYFYSKLLPSWMYTKWEFLLEGREREKPWQVMKSLSVNIWRRSRLILIYRHWAGFCKRCFCNYSHLLYGEEELLLLRSLSQSFFSFFSLFLSLQLLLLLSPVSSLSPLPLFLFCSFESHWEVASTKLVLFFFFLFHSLHFSLSLNVLLNTQLWYTLVDNNHVIGSCSCFQVQFHP